jgi:hypothetical protein
MRKLIVTEYLTLDGVFEEPGHEKLKLTLLETRAFKTGIVILHYQPDRRQ